MQWDPTGPVTAADLDEFLVAAAIDPGLAQEHGVTVASDKADLPDGMRGVDLPAVMWPWKSPTGGVAWQALPPRSTVEAGRPKYRFAKDHLNVLNEIRPGYRSGPVILVEGTKQAYAVASAAPTNTGIYGMAGCYGWRTSKGPVLDLDVVEGRDVFVILDADAAENADVYTAGLRLAETAKDSFLAKSVKFVRLPGSSKQGADDVLAGFPRERRGEMLDRWLNAAKDKPAAAKPPARKKSDDAIDLGDVDRPAVKINGDRKIVVDTLQDTLLQRADRDTLFNVDGKLTARHGTELVLADKGVLLDNILQTALTYKETEKGAIDCWPDDNTLLVLQKRGHKFSRLDGIVTSPFVRDDGSIRTENGYDEATRMYVALTPDVDGITVPDTPTAADVDEAKRLIFDEMLADFPLEDETARANALALLLTPFIRNQVDLAPLAVVNAHSPGTGKTLFAGLAAIVATGNEVRSGMLNSPEEEIRKTMFSALLAGESFLLYDEAHNVDSKQLVEKLTSSTVTDRPLGRTEMISVRQQVTWVAAGNNVLVQADLARRHYRINMFWHGEGEPASRPLSSYKHADIRRWVKQHRRDLVRACLVIIRAWYAHGKPESPETPGFGSFEQWTGMLSGILHHAGVPGFLANLDDSRSDNDTVSELWREHLFEMSEQVGDEWKTAKELTQVLRQFPDMTRPPLDRLDVSADTAPRQIGIGYVNKVGRNFGGFTIERSREKTNRGVMYRIVTDESFGELPVGADSGSSDSSLPLRVEKKGDSGTGTPETVGGGVETVSPEAPESPAPARPAGLPDGLDWSLDPEHPGVWNARLPEDWTRPTRDMGARNDRFDAFLSVIPDATHGSCRKHPDAEHYHPRGGHLATCSECFPGDFDDNAFRP